MENQEELALSYIGDCLYAALLGQPGAARPAALVRSLPPGVRVSVALIREVLEQDERFEEFAGRFDIADRERLRKRPFGGAVTDILKAAGRPLARSLMVSGLARLRGGAPAYFEELLDDFERTRDEIIYVDDHVAPADWLLSLEWEDEDAVLFYNSLRGDEELAELRAECEERDLRKRDPGLTAANILETFKRPLGPRQLAFLVWVHHPQIFDPEEFLASLIERDDIAPIGGRWFSESMIDELHRTLRELSEEASGEGEEIPEIDIAEVLQQEAPSTPYLLETEDRSNILGVLGESQVPIGIDELIIDLLEITPDQKKFVAAAHAVQSLLMAEETLVEVSPGRYVSREAIPEWVYELPEVLVPWESEFDEDVLLELEGLPEDLREEVLDPVFEDVACGVEIEADPDLVAEDSADCPVLHHHYIAGTLPIRKIDRPVFKVQSDVSLLLLRAEDEAIHPCWINLQLGVLFGLSRWYEETLPPSGATFTIAATEDPDSYDIRYDGDTDEELTPDEDRMARLERKRERVTTRPLSIHDLMAELLGEHEDGLTFNALWAEMNAVRRTSRWQLASLLAYYPCFRQEGSIWTLDTSLLREPGEKELEEFVIREEAEEEQEADEGSEED